MLYNIKFITVLIFRLYERNILNSMRKYINTIQINCMDRSY
jgi:hypothetical protein